MSLRFVVNLIKINTGVEFSSIGLVIPEADEF